MNMFTCFVLPQGCYRFDGTFVTCHHQLDFAGKHQGAKLTLTQVQIYAECNSGTFKLSG